MLLFVEIDQPRQDASDILIVFVTLDGERNLLGLVYLSQSGIFKLELIKELSELETSQ